ncbi:hypothetical protein [Inquilinus sp. Marseille-Q2685]|uniref:hypothetical protein n=1 Tax=Inquilinus sp. Marseille-Q2685 TaxID=2866581 RepID=UPI001CE40A1F|nr:hypothetical protein [Inquilinus sp. Marseille-Q2685]
MTLSIRTCGWPSSTPLIAIFPGGDPRGGVEIMTPTRPRPGPCGPDMMFAHPAHTGQRSNPQNPRQTSQSRAQILLSSPGSHVRSPLRTVPDGPASAAANVHYAEVQDLQTFGVPKVPVRILVERAHDPASGSEHRP